MTFRMYRMRAGDGLVGGREGGRGFEGRRRRRRRKVIQS